MQMFFHGNPATAVSNVDPHKRMYVLNRYGICTHRAHIPLRGDRPKKGNYLNGTLTSGT